MREASSRFAGSVQTAAMALPPAASNARSRRFGLLLALVVLALVAAAPAKGAEFHPYKFFFDGTGSTAGQFADLETLAVEQTTGTVYAFDRTKVVIDKFDASGNPQNFSSTGTSSLNVAAACPGFSMYQYGEEDIAVDSSGTANQGNIYLASYGGGGVCAFNSAGEFLWRMTPEEDPKIGGACGVTTDSLGRLWVGSYGNGAMRYTATGSPPTLVAIAGLSSSCRFAVGTGRKDLHGRRLSGAVSSVGRSSASRRRSATTATPWPSTRPPNTSSSRRTTAWTSTRPKGITSAKPGPGRHSTRPVSARSATRPAVAVRSLHGRDVRRRHGVTAWSRSTGRSASFPDVTTGDASNITRTSAKTSGEVVPTGGSVTNCHVEWGTTTAYGNSTSCSQATPFSSATPVSANLTGLAAGTTYHYRVVAENAVGANYGGDKTFSTPFVDGVTTGAATGISRTEATLHGSLEPNGLDAHYYFEWGTSQGYGETTPAPPGTDAGSGAGSTPASATIGGLQYGTTYHYRLVATNEAGTTYGEDETFETLKAVVGLETTAATNLSQTGATLSGKLDPDGLATNYYFEWGPTPGYGNVTSAPPGTSAGSVSGSTVVSAPIEGLSSYTTYHYRLVASNSIGTTYGNDEAVTTLPPLLPAISGTSASAVDSDSATLSAEINPGFGQTVYRFQYGREPDYEFRMPQAGPLSDDNVNHSVSMDVSDLLPGITYHYRVVAINFAGVSHGPDRTFTTQSAPKIESASASGIGQTSAHIAVQINPGLSPATYHVEYGGVGYGKATPESGVIGSDGGNHGGSVDLSGLSPGTTYHFRVVASNGIGTLIVGRSDLYHRGGTQRSASAACHLQEGLRQAARQVREEEAAATQETKPPAKAQAPRHELSPHGRGEGLIGVRQAIHEKRSKRVRSARLSRPNTIRASLIVASTAIAMCLGAAPATANSVHLYETTWNTPSGSAPSPQAVDLAGNVYVYNKGFSSVSKYDPDGNPVNFSALGTNTIDGQGGGNCPSVPADCDRVPLGAFYAEEGFFAHVPTVAVDTTTGPTSGYIYVENAGPPEETNAQVEVFAPTGAYIGEINTNSDGPGHINHRPASVNVDQHGNVYVRAQGVLDKFVPIDGNPAHDVYGGQIRARILLYGQSNEYTMTPIDGAGGDPTLLRPDAWRIPAALSVWADLRLRTGAVPHGQPGKPGRAI